MLIYGKITICAPMKTQDGATLYETRFTDASKPMALRTPGESVTYLSEDTRKLFPSGDEIEGSEFTMHVREYGSGKNGTIKFKGRVVKGILTTAQFGEEGAGPLPTRPAPASNAQTK